MKKDFKRHLKKALELSLKQYETNIATPQLPPENLNKMKDSLCQNKRIRRKVYRRRLIPALIVILILAMVICTMAVTVFFQNNIHPSGKGIKATYGASTGILQQQELSEADAYQLAKDTLSPFILIPKWIPAELELKTMRVLSKDIKFSYENKDGRFLELAINQQNEETGNIFDAENGTHESKKIRSWMVELYSIIRDNTNETWFTAYWSDNDLQYTIDTNIKRDELIKFIENLKEAN